MYLFDLDETLVSENHHLEIKLQLDDNDELPSFVIDKNGKKRKIIKPTPEWLKTVDGFANYEGGKLVLGVRDDFSLIGFEHKEIDAIKNKFNNMVNLHLNPRPIYIFREIKYKVREKIRYVLSIDIKESEYKPVILKYEQIPSIYMRRDGFTSSATYEELEQMTLNSKKVKFDLLPSTIKYKKEDFKDLQELYAKYTDKKSISDKKLQAMGFYDEKGYLANGALLFKDDYSGENTTVRCMSFPGYTRGDDKAISNIKMTYNIPQTIEAILEFIEMRENHSFIKKDIGRINIDAYPKRALIEGIINAIAHRDYLIDDSQIKVDMFKDRIEISSPGGFLKGEKIEKTYNLASIISRRRNALISDVLVECNLMEASGTGFEKIMEDYSKEDDNHRPYVYSSPIQFTLVLPDITYENGIIDSDTPKLIIPYKEDVGKHGEEILSFCYRKARSTQEIADYLKIGNSTYFRNNILENLVNRKYLIKDGNRKRVTYSTNQDMVSLV